MHQSFSMTSPRCNVCALVNAWSIDCTGPAGSPAEINLLDGTESVAGYEETTGGNPSAWFESCGTFTALGTLGGSYAESHGVNNADLVAQTAGVECRKDDGVLDEIPSAYKDIDAVMAAQSDLVDVVATLKQILCVKG